MFIIPCILDRYDGETAHCRVLLPDGSWHPKLIPAEDLREEEIVEGEEFRIESFIVKGSEPDQ